MKMAATVVTNLKKLSMDEALAKSIPIRRDTSLVPVGRWILENSILINLMCEWRTENKESFFAQIEPDAESMRDYLTSRSIRDNRNLLFIIFVSGQPIGHLGLSQISGSTAHLDQVMKAIPKNFPPKHPGLMESSIKVLGNWSAITLGLKVLKLEVISSNVAAIKLYEKCKFVLRETIPLTKVFTESGIRLIEDTSSKNPELYKHVMQLELS